MEPEPAEPHPGPALPLDRLDAGDPRFVAALRATGDAAALAHFAPGWYADSRPEAREHLLAYLNEPPNAPGHEGLIKRLFKLAEAAGDDAVMARFLVLTDRLIERTSEPIRHHRRRQFSTPEAAQAQHSAWAARGWHVMDLDPRSHGQHRLRAWRATTTPARLGTTLPRPNWEEGQSLAALSPAEIAARRWFTVATRRYLQRRAWRYFRALGQLDPERYIAAAGLALGRYRDDELGDGRALLDHSGLIHLLFETSPALWQKSSGWDLAPGQTLADLAPSPAFEAAWRDRPAAVLEVLLTSPARVVARWALRWVEADAPRFAALAEPTAWVNLLDRADPEIVRLALTMLADLPVERLRRDVSPAAWVQAVGQAAPAHQAAVAALAARVVEPAAVPRALAVRLALSPFEPAALLGWDWVVAPVLTEEAGEEALDDPATQHAAEAWFARLFPEVAPLTWERRDALLATMLPLIEAPCATIRHRFEEFVAPRVADRHLQGDGRAGRLLQAAYIWAFLQSQHRIDQVCGWAWMRHWDQPEEGTNSPAGRPRRDDHRASAGPILTLLWDRLTRSPNPRIQEWCLGVNPPSGADPSGLDPLHAAILLRPHGSAASKPAAVRRVVARLAAIPAGADTAAEVEEWIDLVAAVTRSPRAPERRSALAGLVQLAEARPEWQGRIEAAVPALQFAGGPAIMPTSDAI